MPLQNADINDKLKVAELRVDVHTPAHFRAAILVDFGSANDASNIHSSSLLTGDLGIDGFLTNVIHELLDTLPLDHASYTPLMELLLPL